MRASLSKPATDRCVSNAALRTPTRVICQSITHTPWVRKRCKRFGRACAQPGEAAVQQRQRRRFLRSPAPRRLQQFRRAQRQPRRRGLRWTPLWSASTAAALCWQMLLCRRAAQSWTAFTLWSRRVRCKRFTMAQALTDSATQTAPPELLADAAATLGKLLLPRLAVRVAPHFTSPVGSRRNSRMARSGVARRRLRRRCRWCSAHRFRRSRCFPTPCPCCTSASCLSPRRDPKPARRVPARLLALSRRLK